MRKSPLNYLITIAFGAILWVITAVFYGGSFSESLMLSVSTPEEFLANFRIYLGIAAVIGIMNCLYWYYYGGLESTAGDLVKATKIWWTSFVTLIFASAGVLFGLIYKNLAEGILTTDWLVTFGLISLHTWIFFWFCTFFLSPDNVKNIPLFK